MSRNFPAPPVNAALKDLGDMPLAERAPRPRAPTVADKTFLISIGDRTLGGLICRTRWSAPGKFPWPIAP